MDLHLPRLRRATSVTPGDRRASSASPTRAAPPPSDLTLSRRRARTTLQELRTALGPGAPPLRAEGRGEAEPVAANTIDGRDAPAGRARNRRVELRWR